MNAFERAAQLTSTVSVQRNFEWWHITGVPPEESAAQHNAEWQLYLLHELGLRLLLQLDPYPTRIGPLPGLPEPYASQGFASADVRKAFVREASYYADLYEPEFLCVAMEITAYFEKHYSDFPNFVAALLDARDEIKRRHPDTIVFVSVQFELMLREINIPPSANTVGPNWTLVDDVADAFDAVGISTYPMAQFYPTIFGDPASIHPNYYNRLREHTGRPIIFTEIGWPTAAQFDASPQSQSAFIARFPDLVNRLDVPVANWNFLHDRAGTAAAFDTMGLIDRLGQLKPAALLWSDLDDPGVGLIDAP